MDGGHCVVPSDEERLVWSFISPLLNQNKAAAATETTTVMAFVRQLVLLVLDWLGRV